MEKEETLKEYLDRIHCEPGSDEGFVLEVISNLPGINEMCVSRRYLECEPNKKLLNYIIVDYAYPYMDIYGHETIKLFITERS